MGADDLAMQGARASATMILSYLNRDKLVLACLDLILSWNMHDE